MNSAACLSEFCSVLQNSTAFSSRIQLTFLNNIGNYERHSIANSSLFPTSLYLHSNSTQILALKKMFFLKKKSADKIWSKKGEGIKVSPPVPNRVKLPFDAEFGEKLLNGIYWLGFTAKQWMIDDILTLSPKRNMFWNEPSRDHHSCRAMACYYILPMHDIFKVSFSKQY